MKTNNRIIEAAIVAVGIIGIKDSEISVNAPTVIDLNAERYNSNQQPFRYNITSVITVSSQNVKLVRSIIAKQGELLQQGIAIVDGGYENPIKYERQYALHQESACGHHYHLRAEGLSAKSPKLFFNFGDHSFSLFPLHFSLYIVKSHYFFY